MAAWRPRLKSVADGAAARDGGLNCGSSGPAQRSFDALASLFQLALDVR